MLEKFEIQPSQELVLETPDLVLGMEVLPVPYEAFIIQAMGNPHALSKKSGMFFEGP